MDAPVHKVKKRMKSHRIRRIRLTGVNLRKTRARESFAR